MDGLKDRQRQKTYRYDLTMVPGISETLAVPTCALSTHLEKLRAFAFAFCRPKFFVYLFGRGVVIDKGGCAYIMRAVRKGGT